MPPQSKRALANDAEKSPRPPKRASPSDTTSPPPNTYSNMVREALSTIGDYTYFDREMSSAGSPDQEDSNYLFSNPLQSPEGLPLPAVGLGNPYGEATDDNEYFDPAESPSVFMQKHLPAYEHATPSPPLPPVQPLLSSSPLDKLARELAAAKTTKLPNSSDDDPMEDATPTRPQRRAGSDEESTAEDELHMDEPQMEPQDLTQLPPQARQEYYKAHFGAVVMELKDADYPPDCYTYPTLAEEIWSAYLQYVTFTVTIWTNYDSSFRSFFCNPRRIQDCGKPYLTPKQGKRLQKLIRDRQLGSVRLLIGTAFRSLCAVNLYAFYDKRAGCYTLQGNGDRLYDHYEQHDSLVERLKQTLHAILEDGLTGDRTRTGLYLEDLHLIAKDFVYEPRTRKEEEKKFHD